MSDNPETRDAMECFIGCFMKWLMESTESTVARTRRRRVYDASDLRVVSGAHQIATMPKP